MTLGTNKTTFDYLPDSLRYRKVTPSKTVQYHYNNNGKVIAESDGSGSVTSDYVWGPDRLLVKKDKTSNKDYYYLYNGHGDVVQIVDTNGNIVNSYDYDAWGNILNQTEGIDNSFKYAGEIYDKETGLYYLRARYYDSQVGRFINEDTVEGTVTDPLSLNWYTYCKDDPVDGVDPSGHITFGVSYGAEGGCGLGLGGNVGLAVDSKLLPAIIKAKGDLGKIKMSISNHALLYGMAELGGTTPAGSLPSFQLTITTASKVKDTTGFGFQAGGSIGVPGTLKAYASYVGGSNYGGVTLGIQSNASLAPVEVHGYVTYTSDIGHITHTQLKKAIKEIYDSYKLLNRHLSTKQKRSINKILGSNLFKIKK